VCSRAESGGKTANPRIDQVEIGHDAGSTIGVLRDDDGGGTGTLRHLVDLAPAEIIRGEEHGDLPFLHQRDVLLHIHQRHGFRAAELQHEIGHYLGLDEDDLLARDLEKAEIHARKALEIWPNMNAAMRMLGVVHTQRGQFDQAILELEKALKNDPFSAETYNNLATAFMQKGQMEKAEELLNTSLQISPDYRVAFLNLGLLNLTRGRYDAAVDYLERAIEQAPNDPSPRNNLAVALMRIGRYDDARKQLLLLVDLNPGVPNWYFNLAITYVLENNFPEAMNWLRRGAQLCAPMTCQKFLSDNDFNPMREYPDFKKLVESLSPNIPTPPQG
jgi:Flp pilus assembly protein TadD